MSTNKDIVCTAKLTAGQTLRGIFTGYSPLTKRYYVSFFDGDTASYPYIPGNITFEDASLKIFEIVYTDDIGAWHWEQLPANDASTAKAIAESKGKFIAVRPIGGSATELEYLH